jgi:hypothetical protein
MLLNTLYEAVSYTWRTNKRDHDVLCDDKTFLVTQNCYTALRYIRSKTDIRVLWIDAICIDQSSITERNHQVRLMGEVYRRAKNVLIWRGEGDLIIAPIYIYYSICHTLSFIMVKYLYTVFMGASALMTPSKQLLRYGIVSSIESAFSRAEL